MATTTITPDAKRRVLYNGDKGNDVLAAQRALHKALPKLGLYPVNLRTSTYGKFTLSDALRFQKRVGIPADGKIGTLTWHALDPYLDAYGKFLLKLPAKPVATNGQKIAHQLEVMLALGMDTYTQARPGPRTFPQPWKRGADCSDSFLLARAIALGVPYDGYGNTGTIWNTYTPIAAANVAVGDAALYGRAGVTTHVQGVVDVTSKANPDSIGFGSAPGNRYLVHARSDFVGYRRTA